VNVSLTPELSAFLERKVASGRYQTTSEVVREALRLLERQDEDRVSALRGLKAKLQRGARQAERGELLDGEAVFEDLKGEIAGRRRPRSA
jgi:antitoxin ParD1/3/4